MASLISVRNYGILPTGQPVEAWTLTGRGGLVLEAITFGGIVTRLLAPDLQGALADVVLGCGGLESYLAGHPFFGAITGRVAGRISGASFTLNGTNYRLARNDGPNHLHGGHCGFDKRVWNAAPIENPVGAPSLRLSYHSPDGEEGYPGNMDVSVTYTITDDNTFLIESEAVSDQVTPSNLTHHSYFNLAGENSGSIEDHRLAIFADQFVPAGEYLTLQGRLVPVGPSNDLRFPRRLGDVIPQVFEGHGDLYALPRDAKDPMKLAARCEDMATGRVMTVSTTNNYLQLYTGRYIDNSCVGKSGVAYSPFAGVCFECEEYPDVADVQLRRDTLLQPGQAQRHATAYAFSVSVEEV